MVEATECERGAQSVGRSVYLAASVELWRYFRQGDERQRAYSESWLACIHTHRLLPVTIFHFPRQILSRLFFTSLFFVYSEREAPRTEGECSSSALTLGMGLAVTSGELTNHDRKKGNPFFASVVTDEGRGNQRQYRRAEVAML